MNIWYPVTTETNNISVTVIRRLKISAGADLIPGFRSKANMIQKRKTFNILLLLATSLTLIFVLSGCGAGDGSIADYTGDGSTTTKVLTSAKLEWEAPTTNENGTPLTDLKGYKLYYGPSSDNYTGSIDVGDTTSVEIATIIDSIYNALPTSDTSTADTVCFAVTAYDTLGNESDYSNEVCGDI
ncbi:MAG: hypothetical protein IEMM0007_1145 [bacterium]|nr:MAG: hypothetical protein IEMM0007_1145 [bacterium]